MEQAQSRYATDDPGLRVAVFSGASEPTGFIAVHYRGMTAMPAGAPMVDYQAIVGEPGLVIDPLALVRALGVARFDFSQMLKDQTAFAPICAARKPPELSMFPAATLPTRPPSASAVPC